MVRLIHMWTIANPVRPGVRPIHGEAFTWALGILADSIAPDLTLEIQCDACRGRGYWDTWIVADDDLADAIDGNLRPATMAVVDGEWHVAHRDECPACERGHLVGRRLWTVSGMLNCERDWFDAAWSFPVSGIADISLACHSPPLTPNTIRAQLAVLADRLMSDGARLGHWIAAYLAGDEARAEVADEMADALEPILEARRWQRESREAFRHPTVDIAQPTITIHSATLSSGLVHSSRGGHGTTVVAGESVSIISGEHPDTITVTGESIRPVTMPEVRDTPEPPRSRPIGARLERRLRRRRQE